MYIIRLVDQDQRGLCRTPEPAERMPAAWQQPARIAEAAACRTPLHPLSTRLPSRSPRA